DDQDDPENAQAVSLRSIAARGNNGRAASRVTALGELAPFEIEARFDLAEEPAELRLEDLRVVEGRDGRLAEHPPAEGRAPRSNGLRRVAKRSRKPEEIAADIVGAVGPHVGVLVEALLSGRSSDLEPAGQPGPPRLAHERGREHR